MILRLLHYQIFFCSEDIDEHWHTFFWGFSSAEFSLVWKDCFWYRQDDN